MCDIYFLLDISSCQMNFGIFIFSLVLGNLYVFIVFNGVTQILSAQRIQLFTILLLVCGVGSLLLLAIRSFNAPYERLGLDDVRPDSDSERSNV